MNAKLMRLKKLKKKSEIIRLVLIFMKDVQDVQ